MTQEQTDTVIVDTLPSLTAASAPVRELHLSQRPDTLEIPGLHARSPYSSLEDLPTAYEMGYFQNDTLLHPEVKPLSYGYRCEVIQYQLWRDDWVTVSLFVCFFLFAATIHSSYRRFLQITKEFIFPSRNSSKEEDENSIGQRTSFFISLILCIMGGIGTFVLLDGRQQYFLGPVTPYVLLAVYTLSWVAYFIVKNMLYRFVNWVFFDNEPRNTWQKASSYLITLEALLFFPLIVVTIYFTIPLQIAVYIALFIAIFSKILLLYKTFCIFFRKIYGILHLFVYFCTLEAMPLLVLLKLQTLIASILTVKI